LSSTAWVLSRPGILGQVPYGGAMCPLAECARCERVRPIYRRGLCSRCVKLCRADGTLLEYGWTKADRMAEFAAARREGLTIGEAAVRAGVDPRTGSRYEGELRDRGLAPWRATDIRPAATTS
jgi:hypothetical protein